jgi:hypothetical protein
MAEESGAFAGLHIAPTFKLTPDTLRTIRPIVRALAAKGATALDVAELLGNKYPVPVIQTLFAEEFTEGQARCNLAVVQKLHDVIQQTGDPRLIQFYLSRRGGAAWSDAPATEKEATPKRLAIG